MRFLNRYYIRIWRRRSVRQWRHARTAHGKRRTACVRRFLLICAAAEGMFLLERKGGLEYLADQALRIRYIEDYIPWEKPKSAQKEPEIHGMPGSTTVKEGISILLDEGSVNIFRVEEYMESPR